MLSNLSSKQLDSFNNPFDEYNANSIEPDRLLALWCTPFESELITGFSESRFRTEKMPIVLQGLRGTGKTMILKYCSYSVLKERAKNSRNGSILSTVKREKSVGFYFRCDDSFINTFTNVFSTQPRVTWAGFFEHYLELQFCRHLTEIIRNIICELDNPKNNELLILESINAQISSILCHTFCCVKDIDDYLDNEIRYIDHFKNDVIFTDEPFSPGILLKLFTVSEPIINSLCESVPGLNDTLFLILIDEFENLGEDIQKFINTAIKFSRRRISFRVGRRSEGIATTATVNDREYLRNGHDYYLAEIQKQISLKMQKDFFRGIADKRLSLSSDIMYENGIIGILGDKEDLDNECLSVCKGRTEHINLILSEKSSLKKNEETKNEIIDIIRNSENPIAETINALWVIRSKDDPIGSAKRARSAMEDFFAKRDNERSRKYKNDYENKYRFAITVLISSLYKRKKMYYGFNAIVHLSDGNTRTFINICRAILNDALFYERDSFQTNLTVSRETQNRAICNYSSQEFNDVCSIIKYGNNIRNLILNIGNVMTEYHRDKRARYPETTQFVFNRLELDKHERDVIDVAESWSMIIRRSRTQRVSAGIDRKGDIYYINRAFCPIFGISYRVRGGVNVQFSAEEMQLMMVSLSTPKKLSHQGKINRPTDFDGQLSLFDGEESDNG